MSITYSECVYVALGVQNTMCVGHIVICGLLRSTIFIPHYLINGTIFEKKNPTEHKTYFDFLYKFCLKYFSF